MIDTSSAPRGRGLRGGHTPPRSFLRFRLFPGGALLATLLLLLLPAAALAAETAEERRIEALERQVAELKAALAELRGADTGSGPQATAELERRIDILAAEIEKLKMGEAALADVSDYGLGPAASKVYRSDRGVSIGGYGELLYENYSRTLDDGSDSERTDQLDLLRAVLYFGYKFSDRWLLNTEIEFEHGSTGEDGSVSVEFAYVDWLARREANMRVGLLLVPMGFLNELHEPTVFHGALRPDTERYLIPSTWRENGLGAFGDLGPFTYRTYLLTGLDASGFSAGGLRGGRQKGSKSKAEDFAWTGRLDWTGVPGLVVGASFWTGRSGQDLETVSGGDLAVGTTILEGHVEWRWRGLRLRGLAARADLDDVAELNETLDLSGTDSVGSKLEGAYVEAGFDVLSLTGESRQSLAPYLRYERLDTQAEVPGGFGKDPANERKILTYGIQYQPIDQLVLKVDYRNVDNEAGTGLDQLNVLFGYIF